MNIGVAIHAAVEGLITERPRELVVGSLRKKDQIIWFQDVDESKGIVTPATGTIRCQPHGYPEVSYRIEVKNSRQHIDIGIYTLLQRYVFTKFYPLETDDQPTRRIIEKYIAEVGIASNATWDNMPFSDDEMPLMFRGKRMREEGSEEEEPEEEKSE